MTIKYLADGTAYKKANNHKDTNLRGGYFDIYIKIDGVRAMRNVLAEAVSRNGKPLYNLDNLTFSDAEIFLNDWATSVSLVRTQTPRTITQDMVYELTDGCVDPRLFLCKVLNPTDQLLQTMMEEQVQKGNEGIVVRTPKGGWIKVVPEKFADIRITGYKEGKGKNAGMLGSFQTDHGSVGTGFSDDQRIAYWGVKDDMLGEIIEVAYREVYEETGKLRFPSFRRERFDKSDESI